MKKYFGKWLYFLIPLCVFAASYGTHLISIDSDNQPGSSNPSHIRYYVQGITLGWTTMDGHPEPNSGTWWSHFTGGLRPTTITVVIKNLDGWLLQQSTLNPRFLGDDFTAADLTTFFPSEPDSQAAKDARNNNRARFDLLNCEFQRSYAFAITNLRLVIAGQVFESIRPFAYTAGNTHERNDTFSRVGFHLDPGSFEARQWQNLIRTVGVDCASPITVALKIGDSYSFLPTIVNNSETEGPSNCIIPLRPYFLQALSSSLLALIVVLVLLTALTTPALRNSDPIPGGVPAWSLSRITLAWWLTICTACFLFLWTMTGNPNNLSSTVPLLLGINGATLLLASKIQTRIRQGKESIESGKSRGLLLDLISEDGVAEVSRLQLVVWNFILGIVFAWQTLTQWQMPIFDASLMTLLGISSTAYVGFKYLPLSAADSPK